MKKLILFFLTASFCIGVHAQTAEDSIKATINKLFEGMKNGDAVMLKACFAKDGVLQSVSTDSVGTVSVRTEDLNEFADFVSKQKSGAADERIVFETIKIDGALATVWTPYRFYYNGSFRHCGADSFQMVRIGKEWKIQYLIDTRRKTGCAAEPKQ